MPKEKVLAKGKFYFITRASGPHVRYTDKEIIQGVVVLTTERIWFIHPEDRFSIRLRDVTMINRNGQRVYQRVPPDASKCLVIDYTRGGEPYSAVIYGSSNAVNALKEFLRQVLEKKVELRESLCLEGDEKRLLMLMYHGIKEWKDLAFLLKLSEDGLMKLLRSLVLKGYLDDIYSLTGEGAKAAVEVIGEVRGSEH